MAGIALLLPYLYTVTPVLYLYGQNYDETSPGIVLLYLGLAIVAATLVLAVSWLATRELVRASCTATIFCALFLNYGRVYQVVANRRPFGMTHVGWHWLLLTLCGAIVLGAVVYFRRTSRDIQPLCRFFAGIGVILLATTSVNLIAEAVTEESPDNDRLVAEVLGALDAYPAATPLENETPERPDVYYIILDGYVRADVLEQLFKFDNSEFIGYLREKGFYVADKSCSNYPYTFLSLSSSLHMQYLKELIYPQRGSPKTTRFYQLAQNPLVGRILQSKGYRFVHFKTNFNATCRSEIADEQIGLLPEWLQNEFAQVFLRTTALRLCEPSVADQHLHAFRSLLTIPKIKGPTFTFAHLIVPHAPYVFDRFGNVSRYVCQSLQFKAVVGVGSKPYVEQLMFVNKKMREVIDSILASSTVRPIIIVQADHGSAASTRPEGELTPEKLDRFAPERLSILNAYLVPEAMRRELYPDITPVNTFRLLLSTCYGERFDLLPEKHFIGWYSDRWKLRDVTALVHPEATDRAARTAMQRGQGASQ